MALQKVLEQQVEAVGSVAVVVVAAVTNAVVVAFAFGRIAVVALS